MQFTTLMLPFLYHINRVKLPAIPTAVNFDSVSTTTYELLRDIVCWTLDPFLGEEMRRFIRFNGVTSALGASEIDGFDTVSLTYSGQVHAALHHVLKDCWSYFKRGMNERRELTLPEFSNIPGGNHHLFAGKMDQCPVMIESFMYLRMALTHQAPSVVTRSVFADPNNDLGDPKKDYIVTVGGSVYR